MSFCPLVVSSGPDFAFRSVDGLSGVSLLSVAVPVSLENLASSVALLLRSVLDAPVGASFPVFALVGSAL